MLRVLRRRSLAALRHEIEPVDASVFARFLPAWQGVGRGRRGTDALVEALEQLQGVAIPASVLERDVLPGTASTGIGRRCSTSCARRANWCGSAPARSAPTTAGSACSSATVYDCSRRGRTSRTHRTTRCTTRCATGCSRAGASFWPDLVAAAGTADESVVLTALWDLVWAGEVTNDTFGPLRVPRRATARRPARGRPNPGRLARLGPPAGAGRWSLVVPLLEPEATPTEIAHANALQLLDRHGIVTREGVKAEGVAGRFRAACIRCSARSKRPAGPGAAGSSPGWAPRSSRCRARSTGLRAHRTIDPDDHRARVLVVAATDPAQPYGAALAWPEHAGRPARAAGRVRRARRRRVRGVPRTGR